MQTESVRDTPGIPKKLLCITPEQCDEIANSTPNNHDGAYLETQDKRFIATTCYATMMDRAEVFRTLSQRFFERRV